MGWTIHHRPDKITGSQKLLKFITDTELRDCPVIDYNFRNWGSELYILSETTEGTPYVIVCLIEQRKARYYGDYGVSVKVMDESCHPYYYGCKKAILKRLGEPLNANSRAWREMCLNGGK